MLLGQGLHLREVDGLGLALEKFGTMKFSEVMQPAIALADEGMERERIFEGLEEHRRTERPAWAQVNTGLFGVKHTSVSLSAARVSGDVAITRKPPAETSAAFPSPRR